MENCTFSALAASIKRVIKARNLG